MDKNGQFIKCPASLLKSKMSSDAKILYLLLSQVSWEQGTRGGKKNEAVMSNRMISEALGWGKNKPTKVVKELLSNGYINQTNVITKDGHKTFRYHICTSFKSDETQKNEVAVVDDVEMDESFSNCIGTIEQGTENPNEESKTETPKLETVESSEEKKSDNEVAEMFNYDQSFDFNENVDYWEKGMEHVDEDTFNKFLVRRFPKNDKVFNVMIERMNDNNKIGWKKYADGSYKYNVYPITKNEMNGYYNDAVRKCAVAVS